MEQKTGTLSFILIMALAVALIFISKNTDEKKEKEKDINRLQTQIQQVQKDLKNKTSIDPKIYDDPNGCKKC